MNKFAATLLFVAIFSLCAYAENSSASISAQGGNITAANFTLTQNSENWQVFWGNEDSSVSSASISISNDTAQNLSNSTRYMSFPSTYEYYVISDASNPFSSSTYAVANTTYIDSYFGLSGHESSSYVFSDTSTFRIYTDSLGSYTDLSLPTVYMSGKYSNGTTNSQAFREGVAMLGGNLIFIVPKSTFYGLDGSNIDFVFALPYNISSSNSYNLFSVDQPTEDSSGSGATQGENPDQSFTPVAAFSWAYNGEELTIYTESDATITARNELGSSYSGVANSAGEYTFRAPAGYRYFISVSKEGYSPTEASIYIPLPTVIVDNKTASDENISKPDDVIIEDTNSGPVLCVGSNCYAPTQNDDFDSIMALSELSCTGSICRFVGISEADFVEKYRLKKVPIVIPHTSPGTPSIFDFGQFFQTVGSEVSSGLGSPTSVPQRERNLFLYVFTFFAILAIFIYALKRQSTRKYAGGYD